MSPSRPRQNFPTECEDAINNQINLELHASYTYMSMSFYFDRDDTAFQKLKDYFKKRSDTKRDHAEKLMTYQNKRGGRVIMQTIQKPDTDEWGTVMDVMETSLTLEKRIKKAFLDLHKVACGHGDAETEDYMEHYLHEWDTKELSDHITNLHRVGGGLGEYLFDKNI